MNRLLKVLALLLSLSATGVAGFFAWTSYQAMKELPLEDLSIEQRAAIVGDSHASVGHGAPAADAHGAPKADAHGAPAADAHGAPAADAHGAPAADAHGAPAADAHGAPTADAHGAPAADAHGGGHGAPAASARKPASGLPLVTLDELFVNVPEGKYAHSLALKVEVELFEESSRGLVDERQSGMKHTIIAAAREQDYYRLNSLAGKLYFKEFLVGKINEYFRQPIVKDVHFSSFFLQ